MDSTSSALLVPNAAAGQCLVVVTGGSSTFSVNIGKIRTVRNLKEAIKATWSQEAVLGKQKSELSLVSVGTSMYLLTPE